MKEESFPKYNNPENKKYHFGNIVINNPSSTEEPGILTGGKTGERFKNIESHKGQTIKSLSDTISGLNERVKSITQWVLEFNNRRTSPDNGNRRRDNDDENINKGRRKVLKFGAAAAAVAGVKTSGLEKIISLIDDNEEINEEISASWEVLSPEEKKEIQGVVKKYDINSIEIDDITGEVIFSISDNQDEQVLSEEEVEIKLNELTKEKIQTVDYEMFEKKFIGQYLKSDQIDINLDVKQEVKLAWENKYKKGGEQHKGLMEALDRMQLWYNEIKQIFDNVSKTRGLEIPPELIYLAIPESHCKAKDKSSASAGGYYQLMKLISRAKGLIINNTIDERFDVLRNAKVAAEYLADLYEEFKTDKNTEDDIWRLALARYNGVYSKEFRRYVKGADYLKNYKTYLEFREARLNKYLSDVFAQGYFENYKIQRVHDKKKKRNETLEEVSKRLGINLEKLRHLNRGVNVTKAGVKLKIPIFRSSFNYEVVSGDSLEKIARRYELPVASIIDDNNLDSDRLSLGQKLQINIKDIDNLRQKKALELLFRVDLHSSLENLNYPEKFYAILDVMKKEGLLFNEGDDTATMKAERGGNRSLRQVSKEHNIALKSLKSVNTHVLNSDVKIPNSVSIYISPKIIVKKHRRNKKIIQQEFTS